MDEKRQDEFFRRRDVRRSVFPELDNGVRHGRVVGLGWGVVRGLNVMAVLDGNVNIRLGSGSRGVIL